MKAKVIKSTGSWYICETDEGQIRARIKGRFRIEDLNTTNPLAVGDVVFLKKEEGLETYMIHEIEERKNYIIRRSPRNPHKNHIIASNLDQLFLVGTMSMPRTSTGFIDRMLMIAEMHHIPATLIINKRDIYKDKDFKRFEVIKKTYEKIGYGVELISAHNEEDVAQLNNLLKDKTTLFAGHSGVGKSTLINQLIPDLDLQTKDISSYTNKGQHTTTFAEMHLLPVGGYIVDTPGIKELAAVDIEPEEVSHYFTEMKDLLSDCKFNNCLHRQEPKCAVRQACMDDLLADSRYDSYLKILDEISSIDYWKR